MPNRVVYHFKHITELKILSFMYEKNIPQSPFVFASYYIFISTAYFKLSLLVYFEIFKDAERGRGDVLSKLLNSSCCKFYSHLSKPCREQCCFWFCSFFFFRHVLSYVFPIKPVLFHSYHGVTRKSVQMSVLGEGGYMGVFSLLDLFPFCSKLSPRYRKIMQLDILVAFIYFICQW